MAPARETIRRPRGAPIYLAVFFQFGFLKVSIGDIDWRTEFHRAMPRDARLPRARGSKAGKPRRVGEPQGLVSTSPAEMTEPQAPPAQCSNLKRPQGTLP